MMRLYPLTERQTEVLGLVAEGLTNQGVAERIFVELCSVEKHTSTIYALLDPPSAADRRVFCALWYLKRVGQWRDTVELQMHAPVLITLFPERAAL